jgi:2,4-dienoyl-CoA reductase-like NADH-dependent reductase (Old Yellow Enzyme family)/thioredoxin reductase
MANKMFPLLFSEVHIGGISLKNRIVMPAMATNFLTDGAVSIRMIDYFVERARGGAGLIITEAAAVQAPTGGKLARHHLNISEDRFIPSLKALTAAVHPYGTKIAVQLSHLGRQIHSGFLGEQPVAPSPIPCPVSREIPRELTIVEIKEIIEAFVQAARRARDAGFDLVELHGCHGYLIGQFFARRSNQRTDKYGGDVRGRARFACEIIQGIKGSLGASFPVIVRINGDDCMPGGATLKDMQEIAPLLVKAGADALHVSAGVYGSAVATVAPMFEKPGCFVDLAAGVKKALSVPVIAVGRITGPHMAEAILAAGKADLIASGRSLLADPAWPQKAYAGETEDICPCMGCNQGCIDRINASMMTGITEPIGCLVNPRTGRESERDDGFTKHPKRVLVIGGGPAGLEAALVAARRGHAVTLWEKEDVPGGQLLLAGAAPGRENFRDYIAFMERQVRKAGVTVVFHKTASLETIRNASPDVLVLATGATPVTPAFVPLHSEIIKTAWDVLRGHIPPGRRIVVLGGGAVGLETAHFLSCRNKDVTVLEATGQVGGDMGAIMSFYLRRMLKSASVEILRWSEVKAIEGNDVFFLQEGKEVRLKNLDAVILALGACANDPLSKDIGPFVPELLVIGDARKPRKALNAIFEGYAAGQNID